MATLAESFVKYIHEDLLQIKHPHFDIAFRLAEAKRQGFAEELGYANIYDLSEKEFNFKRSSTAAYIAVADRFMNGNQLLAQYAKFSYSQLVEMLPLSDYDCGRIKPDMTVKQIRAWRKDHRFVEVEHNLWMIYGSLSDKQKRQFDEQEEQKKFERKQQREVARVQTSGQTDDLEQENKLLRKRIAELEQDLVHADEAVTVREHNVTLAEDKIKFDVAKDILEVLGNYVAPKYRKYWLAMCDKYSVKFS